MALEVASDARPQVKLLIFATILSVALWFIPYADYLMYPIRLFVTFVHEGGHALMTVLTGNSVQSLTVAPDASGVVQSWQSGWISGLLISSAGYVGATTFGAFLLGLIRFRVSPKTVLYGTAAFVAIMTIIFGLFAPVINIFSAQIGIASVAFTVFSGLLLTGGLFAIARYARVDWANFFVSFLAIQCILNAFFDLKNLFFISAMTNAHSDAMNMAKATGLPSIVWVFFWLGISILVVSVALRLYAVGLKGGAANSETLFED